MKILVLYYSMYGHTLKMAQAAQQGAETVEGTEVLLRRAPEFPDNLKRIKENQYSGPVWEQQQDIKECQLDDFKEADGLILASPTRYGNMIAQLKKVIDSTAQLWLDGVFENKPAGVITSTSSTHGGQESTLLSMMIPLFHLGMIVVGVPYSTKGMLHTEGRGGTPYGASTVAGHENKLKPTDEDLHIAQALGKRVAQVALKLKD